MGASTLVPVDVRQTGQKFTRTLRSGSIQLRGLVQIAFGCDSISRCKRNLACMAQNLGVADADGQSRLDILERFCISAIHVKRPSVCVQSENVVPPYKFLVRYFKGSSGLVSVIGVVEDQLTVGIVFSHR